MRSNVILVGAALAALANIGPSVADFDLQRPSEAPKPKVKRKRTFKGSKAAKRQSRQALQGRSSNQ